MFERFAWAVVIAVVVVWIGTTLVLPLVVKGYVAPPGVSTVMGSVAGGAAAYLFAQRLDGKSRDERRRRKGRRRP